MKHLDNIETVKGLKPTLKSFIDSIESPFEFNDYNQINELEWESRSGFIAHSHNRGGYDFISLCDVYSSQGYTLGKQTNKKINDIVDYNFKSIKKDNPEMTDDDIHDAMHNESSEYDDIAFRVRAMYEGDNVLMVYMGYDFDAPYFRWNTKADKTKKIKFKDIKDLRTKLTKLKKTWGL
jgi:hypothetical protein